MPEYPTTVLELHDQFSNESACRRYLAKGAGVRRDICYFAPETETG